MSRAVLDPYLKIQAALADDSMDGVTANAGNVATAASSLGSPAMKIDMAAVQLSSAGEIGYAREKFGTLSEAIDNYMTGLKLVDCWLGSFQYMVIVRMCLCLACLEAVCS